MTTNPAGLPCGCFGFLIPRIASTSFYDVRRLDSFVTQTSLVESNNGFRFGIGQHPRRPQGHLILPFGPEYSTDCYSDCWAVSGRCSWTPKGRYPSILMSQDPATSYRIPRQSTALRNKHESNAHVYTHCVAQTNQKNFGQLRSCCQPVSSPRDRSILLTADSIQGIINVKQV